MLQTKNKVAFFIHQQMHTKNMNASFLFINKCIPCTLPPLEKLVIFTFIYQIIGIYDTLSMSVYTKAESSQFL